MKAERLICGIKRCGNSSDIVFPIFYPCIYYNHSFQSQNMLKISCWCLQCYKMGPCSKHRSFLVPFRQCDRTLQRTDQSKGPVRYLSFLGPVFIGEKGILTLGAIAFSFCLFWEFTSILDAVCSERGLHLCRDKSPAKADLTLEACGIDPFSFQQVSKTQ